MKKICSQCSKKKDEEEFFRLASKPDGRRPNCKDCFKNRQTRNYNKSEYNRYMREYRKRKRETT